MSLSVMGMSMPKCCVDCNLLYDYMHCSITGTQADFEKMGSERLPNCPLKEIIDNTETVEKSEIWENGFADGLAVGAKWVERPKGKWTVTKLLHGEDITCPFCNARPTKSEYGYYLRDNFCHECGADLREGKIE